MQFQRVIVVSCWFLSGFAPSGQNVAVPQVDPESSTRALNKAFLALQEKVTPPIKQQVAQVSGQRRAISTLPHFQGDPNNSPEGHNTKQVLSHAAVDGQLAVVPTPHLQEHGPQMRGLQDTVLAETGEEGNGLLLSQMKDPMLAVRPGGCPQIALFTMGDISGDGSMSKTEWGTKKGEGLFGKLDKDGDGDIEQNELKVLVEDTAGPSCGSDDTEPMWKALVTYDAGDKNGKLDPDEWLSILTAADANGSGNDQNDGDMSAEEWENCPTAS